jgi:hypothetical protein
MENFQGENFQALSSVQGKIGEDLALIRLKDYGFHNLRIREQLKSVEVDIIACNKQGIDFFFTVKASWRGDRQGCKRIDTLKKAICEGLMIQLETGRPTIIITSHKPRSGRGKIMLDMIPKYIIFDVIELQNDGKRLKWLANADENDIQKELMRLF